MTHMLQDLDARAGRSGGAEQAAPTRLSSLLDARVLLAAALGVFLSQLYMQRFFLHDDALISLRFARSFVGTGALEWNLGERVEGYTNFLHILATSILMKFGFDPIHAVRTINVASGAALLAATWVGLVKLLPRDAPSAHSTIGLALVLLAGPLPLWIFGGLETVMVAALVTAGMVCTLSAVEAAGDGASRNRNRLLAIGGADSDDVGRGFRVKPATYSDRSRPPIPGMSATPPGWCSRVDAVDTIWR